MTPRQNLDTPLAAAPTFLDQPALFERKRIWTWRQVHEESIALSRRIAGASAVYNVCSSRLGFLITFLAALRSRSQVVLPPSNRVADGGAVLERRSHAIVVGDTEGELDAAGDDRSQVLPYVPCRPTWSAVVASDEELAWHPDWDGTSVVLYTSGSTGRPEAQSKSLRHLAIGARVLGARLSKELEGGLATLGRMVCSVPSQHMFGLECSVMLPLMHGMSVLERRPLLPADVFAAFADCQSGAWIATPMHLRSLAQSGGRLRACSVVIASTMPLTAAIARQCEDRINGPVLEIYGSTETGVLAMRRTAKETRWRPVDEVAVWRSDDANIASGSHFPSPVKLLDELLLEPDGCFTMLGRQSDLVKIAGRRTSLAGLNELLHEMPGLEDGVFYLPTTGNVTERLCLMYAGPPIDRAAARRWLRKRLDSVFLPRVFIRLERLPRGENGKLPRIELDRAFAEWQSAAQRRGAQDTATSTFELLARE